MNLECIAKRVELQVSTTWRLIGETYWFVRAAKCDVSMISVFMCRLGCVSVDEVSRGGASCSSHLLNSGYAEHGIGSASCMHEYYAVVDKV